ncbi:MAG: topoisomerase DNA-binding C4 zinc finger domain-containing protein [Planctomycetaceae bacterium]|nr:topoisomerase DNA-binding C4 zinc finger domain-containing protein [Planctomycetaceae bacterium]
MFATAGLPLLHVAAARSYSVAELAAQIAEKTQQPSELPHGNSNSESPSSLQCPKCGSELVQRISSKGPNQGQPFLGCSAYPKCRHTEPLPPR